MEVNNMQLEQVLRRKKGVFIPPAKMLPLKVT
jgi:hypothetical protein